MFTRPDQTHPILHPIRHSTSNPTSDPTSKSLLVDFRLLHCPLRFILIEIKDIDGLYVEQETLLRFRRSVEHWLRCAKKGTLSRPLQLSPSPSDPTLRSRQGAATWDQPAEDRTQCSMYAVQRENMHVYCVP